MNDDNQFPTPSPTIQNNNVIFFVLVIFINIITLISLYFVCYKRELLRCFNQNKVTTQNNFNKYFIDNKIDIEDEDLCSICLSNFDDKDVKILKCNHFFHNDCIIKWLQVKKICPNCKVNLKSTVYGTEV